MDTTQNKSREIVSFNESIPEISDLLNLDGAALDQVVGGIALGGDNPCGTFTCGTFSCTNNNS